MTFSNVIYVLYMVHTHIYIYIYISPQYQKYINTNPLKMYISLDIFCILKSERNCFNVIEMTKCHVTKHR